MRGQRFGRVPCALAIAFLFTNAAADSVGTVTKVVNQAQIGSNTAVSGIPVYMASTLSASLMSGRLFCRSSWGSGPMDDFGA
jgi:hypothetical protein